MSGRVVIKSRGIILWPVIFLLLMASAPLFLKWSRSSDSVPGEAELSDGLGEQAGLSAAEWIPPGIRSGEVVSGESFYDLMKGHGVSDLDIMDMSASAKPVYDLRKIRSGYAYNLELDLTDLPIRFEYEISSDRKLVLNKAHNQWSAEVVHLEFDLIEDRVQGVIKSSLYLSLVDACGDTGLAVELADIFAWDIDFALDLREGDRFGILYEKRWHDGQFKGRGRILAARFVNDGRTFDAVYDGEQAAYFDSEGKSLQKQFLKSPLRFKYISSYFSRNRLHPILKIRRPHLGVDYAAPYGTPVRASADGRVDYVGWNGGMGKMIKIRHNAVYSTAYGHLSRYARGMKRNKTVRQGDIIAYVGSTGISTGPHLHYSFYKNGKLMDPLDIKNPRTTGIPEHERDQYKKKAGRLLESINPPAFEQVTVATESLTSQ
jgi:murein DD-endopeptidase MepM/ murein hydrolase activator NlpD